MISAEICISRQLAIGIRVEVSRANMEQTWENPDIQKRPSARIQLAVNDAVLLVSQEPHGVLHGPWTAGRTAPHLRSLSVPPPASSTDTFTAWHPETGGPNRSEPERASGREVPLVREDACGDRCDQSDVAPAKRIQGLGRAADGSQRAERHLTQ